MSGLFIGQWAYYHRSVTLGRGGGTFRRAIIILLVVSLFAVMLSLVLVVGRPWGEGDDAESSVDSGAGDVPAERVEPKASPSEDAARGDELPTQIAERADGGERAERVDESPLEPLGSRLQGPRGARMQRWEPRFGGEEPTRTESARSTRIDAVVRGVSLTDARGRDAVAVRIARGRWDELATGVTSGVPQIVWEPVERSVTGAGELQAIYAVENALRAEYILRFENDRLFLRLYGNGSSVDDAEIEALPRP